MPPGWIYDKNTKRVSLSVSIFSLWKSLNSICVSIFLCFFFNFFVLNCRYFGNLMLLLPFVFNKLAKFACQLNEGEQRHGAMRGSRVGWQRRLMLYGSDFYFLFPAILNYCYGRREGVFVYAYRSYIALFIARLVGIFISLCVLCVRVWRLMSLMCVLHWLMGAR